MREYGHQCVVWQTAVNPVVALELLATGTWSGTGVLGPEAFDAVPFLDLLTAYGSPWGQRGDGRRLSSLSRLAPVSTERPARGGVCGAARDTWRAERGSGARGVPQTPSSGAPDTRERSERKSTGSSAVTTIAPVVMSRGD